MARHREFEPTEVIDKSIDVFLSKGYDGAAIRDLIEVTNVKSGSLYNSFGSKKQMFKNALERFVEVSQFNITLADAETAPPRETIEKLFFDLIEVTDKRGAVGKCLISRATMEVGGVDKEITAWLQEVFEKSERLLCRLIERGQAAGEISSFPGYPLRLLQNQRSKQNSQFLGGDYILGHPLSAADQLSLRQIL